FHVPRKDKCSICIGYKKQETSNDETINFNIHVEEKELAQKQYLIDQKKLNSNRFLCSIFDMQKVLSTPHGELDIRVFYYCRYSVYNETIYEAGTQNAYCYIWGEADGKRGSNEVSSVLYNYLRRVDLSNGVSEISLFCDSSLGKTKTEW
ncbi:unnamed protein product, partial [Psylliodes chrysocephalus]